MGSIICTAGFPFAALFASCVTARCDSIRYGFFIATLLFSAKENSLSAYQGWERGVATFYDLPGISPATFWFEYGTCLILLQDQSLRRAQEQTQKASYIFFNAKPSSFWQ